jgi:hypothetical protein
LQLCAVLPGSSATWTNVVVPTTGTYNLRIYYENGSPGTGTTINVTANGAGLVVSPPFVQTDPGGGYGTPGYITTQLPLNAGTNSIMLWIPSGSANGAPNIDRIVVGFNPVSN